MNKKAISPVFATMILVALAVLAAIAVYSLTAPAFNQPKNPTNTTTYNLGEAILNDPSGEFYFHGIIDINSEILIIGHQTPSSSMCNIEISNISNNSTFWLLEHQYQIVNFTQSQITLTELRKP